MPRTCAGARVPGILGVAQLIREYRIPIARTLRGFGVGLSDLGGALRWGEARLLIEAAAGDPSTVFGAELAGWAYPASTKDLISLTAQIGDPKASKRVMPWALQRPASAATADEVAVAQAQLEDEIVFT